MNARTGSAPYDCAGRIDGKSAVGGEPVAWRWRPRGSTNWIYDPTPEWRLEHQGSIEAQPLYAQPQFLSDCKHTPISRCRTFGRCLDADCKHAGMQIEVCALVKKPEPGDLNVPFED